MYWPVMQYYSLLKLIGFVILNVLECKVILNVRQYSNRKKISTTEPTMLLKGTKKNTLITISLLFLPYPWICLKHLIWWIISICGKVFMKKYWTWCKLDHNEVFPELMLQNIVGKCFLSRKTSKKWFKKRRNIKFVSFLCSYRLPNKQNSLARCRMFLGLFKASIIAHTMTLLFYLPH